eukprot:105573_1
MSDDKKYSFSLNAIAGGCTGMSVDVALFPLDTIKTRLQARLKNKPIKKGSLYSGLGAALLAAFSSAAIFFSFYEASKTRLIPHVSPGSEPLIYATSAAIGDMAACCFKVPCEGVKQQMQAGHHKSSVGAVQAIYRSAGLRGFYAGFMSTVLREVPFDMIQFIQYEVMKTKYRRHYGEKPSTAAVSVIGAIAGGVSALLTTPIDVVKTRLMTQNTLSGSPRIYNGTVDCFRKLYAESGYSVFFRGSFQRTIYISLGGAIFFGVFDFVRENADC